MLYNPFVLKSIDPSPTPCLYLVAVLFKHHNGAVMLFVFQVC